MTIQAPEREMLDELRRIVKLDDEARTKYGGLADCTDNDGHPYQSQELANCLSRARAILSTPPVPSGDDELVERLQRLRKVLVEWLETNPRDASPARIRTGQALRSLPKDSNHEKG